MGDTPFARLAHLGEQLERTAKHLELTTLLSAVNDTLGYLKGGF